MIRRQLVVQLVVLFSTFTRTSVQANTVFDQIAFLLAKMEVQELNGMFSNVLVSMTYIRVTRYTGAYHGICR